MSSFGWLCLLCSEQQALISYIISIHCLKVNENVRNKCYDSQPSGNVELTRQWL